MRLRAALDSLLDFVFPRHCLFCGRMNPRGPYRYLCENCANGPFSYQVARCKRCAEIVGSDVSPPSCAKCETELFHFSEAFVACEYASAGRALVLELKYRGGLWAAADMVKIISEARGFEDYFRGSVLVPVPLSRKRRRVRGYNQSEVVARMTARAFPSLGMTTAELLKRRRHTGTQTALTRQERAIYVRGAFALSGADVPKDSRIIIVDDVITSCATVNECARVLKRAGYSDIRVFAFARRS